VFDASSICHWLLLNLAIHPLAAKIAAFAKVKPGGVIAIIKVYVVVCVFQPRIKRCNVGWAGTCLMRSGDGSIDQRPKVIRDGDCVH
jgi:hypothetical protein